jgi:formylglycine-generating enzyme
VAKLRGVLRAACLSILTLVACDPASASVRQIPEQRRAESPSLQVAPPPVPAAPELESGCPPEMSRVGPACVDRWEAHLVEIGPDGKEIAHPHYDRPKQGARYAARSASGVLPQGYVNRHEAKAACEAAGKRLCRLTEWYRACIGSKRAIYGYGTTYQKGVCNAGKPHLLGRLFGNNPGNWRYDDHFNSPKLNQEPGFLARTGEHAGCTNDNGVFDMIGNLHEWVRDPVDRSLEHKLPLRDDIRRKIGVNLGKGIFMGGFYSTISEHGRGCAFVTPGHEPRYHDYSTGFRCCADPRDAE